MPDVFFFNDTATTEIYTLSLHDALPICQGLASVAGHCNILVALALETLHQGEAIVVVIVNNQDRGLAHQPRSEEHTSELQSRQYLVCRLLLEKKKRINRNRVRADSLHRA